MKTINSKETVRSFLTIITKMNRVKTFWVENRIEFARLLKKLRNTEGIHSHYTVSETRAALAERTVGFSKNHF